jgi:predicted nicotinamide N-methyase
MMGAERIVVEGEQLKAVEVDVAPGVRVLVYERADEDRLLEAAIEDPSIDPYAGVLWPTSLAVARVVAGCAAPGERVLDLGAGTGLAALTAASVGARALALDHDAAALRLIALAAERQGLAVDVHHFDLHAADPLPPADLVVLADLLYDPALARSAARRVAEAVGRGSRVLVGDPGRLGRAEFLRTLAGYALYPTFEEVTVCLPGEERTVGVGVARVGW